MHEDLRGGENAVRSKCRALVDPQTLAVVAVTQSRHEAGCMGLKRELSPIAAGQILIDRNRADPGRRLVNDKKSR
jgi:hypothetical protein